jgi:hypothetical protein
VIAANPVASLHAALADMTNPNARAWARETYTAGKKRGSGRPVDNLVGGAGVRGYAGRGNRAWEKFRNYRTQQVEEWTMEFAALAARHTAIAKGVGAEFGDRARTNYADSEAANTQGMFNRQDREAVLNSQTVQGLNPYQGYSMAVMNKAREDVGSVGVNPSRYGVGKAQQGSRATARIIGVVMGNVVGNILRQAAIQSAISGKVDTEKLDMQQIALDSAANIVPFSAILTGGGQSDGKSMPASQSAMVWRSGRQIAKNISEGESDPYAYLKPLSVLPNNWGGAGGVPIAVGMRVAGERAHPAKGGKKRTPYKQPEPR